MGVAPYKTFTFDGVSSADYDVYLTGVGVYNAPKRSVEMFSIAGRNGDYALDQGKFENVSVTYKVGMYDTDENNFATKVSNFRNWLCSKVGYVRLEDEYNPNEYRMAVYADGFELDHDMLIAGEAEIEFNCKPQRWLTSGETETAVANNGTLNNPTLFEASPLLAVKGYGNIAFNGYSIDIENAVLGDVTIIDSDSFTSTKTYTIPSGIYNNGDGVDLDIGSCAFGTLTLVANKQNGYYYTGMPTVSQTDSNALFSSTPTTTMSSNVRFACKVSTTVGTISFTIGTNSTVTNTTTVSYICPTSGGNVTCTWSLVTTITYTSSSQTITISFTSSASSADTSKVYISTVSEVNQANNVNAVLHSTTSALGNPTYIDCEIGECYMISGGEIVSLNSVIDLGSDLPVLASGTNTFTYDNTITSFKVTPRWWKV